jgi:hypothetical protein
VANSSVIDPKGENTEVDMPVSSYAVVQSKPFADDVRFVAAELYPPAEENADGKKQKTGKTPVVAPSTSPAKTEAREKAAGNRTKVYAALGVGLGMLAAGIGVFFIHPGKQDGSFDFGSVTAKAYGLKGHLTTNWGDRLDYKLTVEPSDPKEQASFQNAVSLSPRPLAVDIQLKDATGQVLCNNPVLLRFDPLRNNPASTSDPGPRGRKIAAGSVEREQVAQALNNARLEAQEIDREHGKDLFQENAGPDEQIASLSAQGTLPCSKKQYLSTVSWALTSNFPIVVALDLHAPGSGQGGDLAASGGTFDKNPDAPNSPAAKMKPKPALPVSHFSIEEDDSIVGYQPSSGVLETRGGKAFQMEKKDMVTSALKGVDLPLTIHYRCDQFGACALAGVCLGIQRAWLER